MTVERGKGWEMHLGDCIAVMATLEKADHVITDPPYEVEAHTLQRRLTTSRKVREPPLFFGQIGLAEREDAGRGIARLAKRWALVFCQVEAVSLWSGALAPLRYKRACAWVKPGAMCQVSGDRPGMGYESIVCAHAAGRSSWNGGGRVGVFTHTMFEQKANEHVHPTQKPIALMLELVSLFTDPDETILDPFTGSGTTGVACLRLGRKFIGIEKDPTYFALACERLRAEEQGSTLQAARAGQLPLLG